MRVGDPDAQGESVGGAAEGDRDSARQDDKKGGTAVVGGVDFGTRGEGREGREGTGDV